MEHAYGKGTMKGYIDLTEGEEKKRNATFWYMVIISMGVAANTYIDVPNYGLLIDEFHVSTLALGLMTGVFLIVYGLSSIIWAFFNEKAPSRRVLLNIALIVSTILTFTVLLSWDFSSLFLFRVLSGLFLGAISPIVYSILIDLYKAKERVKALYQWSFLTSVGSGIGFGASSILGGIMGWRGAFSVGFFTVLIGTVLSFRLFEPPRAGSEEEIEELLREGKSYSYRLSLSDLKKLPNDKFLKVFMIHALFTAITWGAFGTWTIHMLSWEVGLSNIQSLAILTMISMGAAFSIPISRLLDSVRIRRPRYVPGIMGLLIFLESIFFIMFLFTIPRYPLNKTDLISVVSWFINDPVAKRALLFGFIAMAISNIKGPMLQAIVADTYLPEYRATVMALTNIAYLVGRSFGIILGGALAALLLSIRYAITLSELFLMVPFVAWLSLVGEYVLRISNVRLTLERRAKSILSSAPERYISR